MSSDVPDAVVEDATDVVVRVDATTICGTERHSLHGDVTAVTDGRVLRGSGGARSAQHVRPPVAHG